MFGNLRDFLGKSPFPIANDGSILHPNNYSQQIKVLMPVRKAWELYK